MRMVDNEFIQFNTGIHALKVFLISNGREIMVYSLPPKWLP